MYCENRQIENRKTASKKGTETNAFSVALKMVKSETNECLLRRQSSEIANHAKKPEQVQLMKCPVTRNGFTVDRCEALGIRKQKFYYFNGTICSVFYL